MAIRAPFVKATIVGWDLLFYEFGEERSVRDDEVDMMQTALRINVFAV
ncbi:MAG: hypothetical protein ACTHQM_25575 [Thermoanaerobaculia bacterium]